MPERPLAVRFDVLVFLGVRGGLRSKRNGNLLVVGVVAVCGRLDVDDLEYFGRVFLCNP